MNYPVSNFLSTPVFLSRSQQLTERQDLKIKKNATSSSFFRLLRVVGHWLALVHARKAETCCGDTEHTGGGGMMPFTVYKALKSCKDT